MIVTLYFLPLTIKRKEICFGCRWDKGDLLFNLIKMTILRDNSILNCNVQCGKDLHVSKCFNGASFRKRFKYSTQKSVHKRNIYVTYEVYFQIPSKKFQGTIALMDC